MQVTIRTHAAAVAGSAARWLPALAAAAILAALWLGPLPAMSRTAMSPHMLLHLGVTTAAAPLLAVSLARLDWFRSSFAQAAGAVFATSVSEMAVVWGWHAPPLHEAAATHLPVFALEQASFLAAATLLWTACIAAAGTGGRMVGAAALLFAFMHMAMFGVLLALAPNLIYSPQFCLGSFGFQPLEDQQFAGALMATVGATPCLAGGCILAYLAISD